MFVDRMRAPVGIVTLWIILVMLGAPHVRAQGSTEDRDLIPTSINAGGLDRMKSADYLLDGTIGEAAIGQSRGTDYILSAGYRQSASDAFISLSCSNGVNIGTITEDGQATASGTCIVITDATAGYSLAWQVTTGSGGASTGYLISPLEDTIAPFTPTTVNTPDTWSVAASDSEWGGRVSSQSTDTATEWGTDDTSEKWLNVRTATSRTIISRSTRTSLAGSNEIIEFRAEVGNNKIQPTGTYQTIVTFTAYSL